MKTAIALALAAAFALPALSIAQASDDARHENGVRHERQQGFDNESRDGDRYVYSDDRRNDEDERHSERRLERHGDND